MVPSFCPAAPFLGRHWWSRSDQKEVIQRNLGRIGKTNKKNHSTLFQTDVWEYRFKISTLWSCWHSDLVRCCSSAVGNVTCLPLSCGKQSRWNRATWPDDGFRRRFDPAVAVMLASNTLMGAHDWTGWIFGLADGFQDAVSEINKWCHPAVCRGGFGIAGSCVRRQSLEASAGWSLEKCQEAQLWAENQGSSCYLLFFTKPLKVLMEWEAQLATRRFPSFFLIKSSLLRRTCPFKITFPHWTHLFAAALIFFSFAAQTL